MREWHSGGAPPCQGGGRGFDPRLALAKQKDIQSDVLFVLRVRDGESEPARRHSFATLRFSAVFACLLAGATCESSEPCNPREISPSPAMVNKKASVSASSSLERRDRRFFINLRLAGVYFEVAFIRRAQRDNRSAWQIYCTRLILLLSKIHCNLTQRMGK